MVFTFKPSPLVLRLMSRLSIARWLLGAARDKGIPQTLADLRTFLSAPSVTAQYVHAIEGLPISRRLALSDATYLVPWTDVTATPGAQRIHSHAIDQTRVLTAALIREVKIDIQLLTREVVSSPAQPVDFKDDGLDMVACASLFGPCAASVMAIWWELPSWFPPGGFSFVLLGSQGRIHDAKWPDEAYDSFPKLYELFAKLDEARKAKLRIPLHRMISAMRRWDQVDSTIDSWIALESLFSSRNLPTRAARYLGAAFTERKKIRQFLGLFKTARNAAVHEGIVPRKLGDVSMEAQLIRGFDLIAKSLRIMIETGEPDWEKLELS